MGKIQVRFLAVSAFEIVTENGKRILIDPCITGYKGQGASPVPLDDIKDIDLILVSHGAGDHIGDTVELAKRMPSCLIMCGGDVRYHLMKKDIDASRFRGAVYGQLRSFGEIQVKVVESKHISFFDSDGEVVSGMPLGFIIFTESGFGIYHPGDTTIFGDMKLYGELYKPQLAMLPVGSMGAIPDMTPEEGALICRWMGLKWAIPVHYPEGSDVPLKFARAVRRETPYTMPVIMKPGEWKTFEF